MSISKDNSKRNALLRDVLTTWDYGIYQQFLGWFGVIAVALEVVFYFILKYLAGFEESLFLRFGSILLVLGFLFIPRQGELKLRHKLYIEFAFLWSLTITFYSLLLMNKVNPYWFASMAFCGFIHGLITFQWIGVGIYTAVSALIFATVRYYPGLLHNLTAKNVILAHVVCVITFIISALIRLMLQAGYKSLLLAEKEREKIQDQLIVAQKAIIQQKTEEAQTLELHAALGKMAAQIAHDIRSPLAALSTVLADLSSIPEDRRLMIRMAAQRINDIANLLLEKNRPRNKLDATAVNASTEVSSRQSVLISHLIDSILTEKRIQYRDKIEIKIEAVFEKDSHFLFSRVNEIEMKRILSNLINNAVESLLAKGDITVRLSASERSDLSVNEKSEMIISVEDTGKGIPADVLPRLGVMGASFDKAEGSGLGLHHAKTQIEKWSGKMILASHEGAGTTVRLCLPIAESPDWFVDKITVKPEMTVVIVDDESTIHQLWENRFAKVGAEKCGVHIVHLSTPDQLKAYVQREYDPLNSLFLVDYEFMNERITGLQIIKELKIQKHSILVTSRYEEISTKIDSMEPNIKLMPKSMAGFIALNIEPERN